MTFLKMIFRCWLLRRHEWGRAQDYDDNNVMPLPSGYVLPHGRYKVCRHCPAFVLVRRRGRKGGA